MYTVKFIPKTPPYLRPKSEIFGVPRYKHHPPLDKTKISQQSVNKTREKCMKVDFPGQKN